MDQNTMELAEKLCLDIVFNGRYRVTDALMILNWCQDHRSVKVYQQKNGFLTLNYCGRCSTIVGEGDRFCSQCGRGLRWND